jgi:HEAT repeat protein
MTRNGGTMNKRALAITLVSITLAVVAIVALLCWPHAKDAVGHPDKGGTAIVGDPKPKNDAAYLKAHPEVDAKILQGVLEALGYKKGPKLGDQLAGAVNSLDERQIRKAFEEAVWSGHWKMDEVAPLLLSYLNDNNAFVRFDAAKTLLTIGDASGVDALMAIVKTKGPMDGSDSDLRIQAANVLAQYKIDSATGPIDQLFQDSKNGYLIYTMMELNDKNAAAIVEEAGYYPLAPSIMDYALAGSQKFVPNIARTYATTVDPDVKVTAAFALATLSGDQGAIQFLAQEADTLDANANGSLRVNQLTAEKALKFLGSIDSPIARASLENALSSSDSQAVAIAAINLLFNQGGSEKAINVLAEQLEETSPPSRWIPWDTELSAAQKLMNNPRIQAAGAVYAQKSGNGSWQLYTNDRKNWSINNWIGGYVVKRK